MGLDMYLQDKEGSEYAYWRKANAIQGWFDDIIGPIYNTTEHEVNREVLEALLKDAIKVKDLLSNATKVFRQEDSHDFYVFEDFDAEVMELLPPTPGFFFGTYEIDQWYEHQLDITISQLTAILDSFDFENETLYYYIWY